MPHVVVVFGRNNARVVHVHPDHPGESLEHWPNAVMNPDLTAVQRVDTVYWTRRGKKIVPIRGIFRKIRDFDLKKRGRDMNLEPLWRKHPGFYPVLATFSLAALFLVTHVRS